MERLTVQDGSPLFSCRACYPHGALHAGWNMIRGRRVPDLACGEGYATYGMAQHWGAKVVVGVDVDRSAIATGDSLNPYHENTNRPA